MLEATAARPLAATKAGSTEKALTASTSRGGRGKAEWSHDGKWIAAGGGRYTLSLFDAATGKLGKRFIGYDGGGMNTFFAAISILAAGFIIFWTTRASVARDRFLCLALGLILGGTLGNLYDRIVFGGVRDFLHCYYDTHIWPDFNIADCCLVCGAGVLLVHSFFVSDHVPQSTTPETAAAEAPMQTTSSPNVV